MIDNRLSIIKNGNFFTQIAPSFAYGLGLYHPLKMVLNCSMVDIQNSLVINPGKHDILLEWNETDPVTLRPIMSVTVI